MKPGPARPGGGRGVGGVVYLGLVFFVPVVFVGADLIHQVPVLVLLFIAVLRILQEVKRLQNLTWTPAKTHW